MDEAKVKGNWPKIKLEVLQIWGDLSEKELENCKGNLHKIASVVEDKYGEDPQEIEKKMDQFLVKYRPQENFH